MGGKARKSDGEGRPFSSEGTRAESQQNSDADAPGVEG